MKRYLSLSILTIAIALALIWGYQSIAVADEPAQGHMHSALHHLEEAKKELDQAAHDKGGHRGKALELTQKAIDEVKQGIEFADQR
jgi:hypothetical protein